MNSLIPLDDLAEFLALPQEQRSEVDRWCALLATVSKPIQRALADVAAQMRCSVQTARRKYDAWRARNWRGVVNGAKCPQGRSSICTPELVETWKRYVQENGRKCKPAHAKLCEDFFAGKPIPGLPPGTPRDKLPKGLSYDNLIRRYKPSKFEMTAARVGRSAAAPYRPLVFISRKMMKVGQVYLFDDMWHDFKVVMIGQRRAMRLLQLHAHDVFSGCQFARGLKPRIEDEATGKSLQLTGGEMLFLLAHVLTDFGFNGDGCILAVEHGTAAISEAIERALFDLSAGKITVERSGMEGASAFAGQYPGRGKGNFRFKAQLESLGNLIHNRTADLIEFPGQTGSNSRINAPEELHGREKHADALLRAILALPESIRGELRLPFLEATKAIWMVEEVMEKINCRREHELEGWLEAGLTTVDYDVPGVGLIPGSVLLAKTPEQRAVIEAAAMPVARKLSPREVFDAAKPNLARFRPEQTAKLLLGAQDGSPVASPHLGKEVSVGQDHLITFEDQDIAPGPLRYVAHHFAPGDKFCAVVNPWSPQVLHLFDATGKWKGQVKAWHTISRIDAEGLKHQMGAAAKIEAELRAPLEKRGAVLTQRRIADAKHNAAVIQKVNQSESAAAALAREALEQMS